MSSFSPELCKLESSNIVYMYICRMGDCFVGLRVTALILLFLYPFFFLYSFIIMLISKICVRVFSGSIAARILELGIYMDDVI